ncbi:MAG: hypothetical protein ACPL3S_01620 [Halothiobacillaceae bacterium]
MAKQVCVAISLSAKEKALVSKLAKKYQCTRTDLVRLALRWFLERAQQERGRQ